jgi:hypothetical protein
MAEGQLSKLRHRFMQVARALLSFLIMRTVVVQFYRFFKLMFEGNVILERATTSMARLGGSMAYAQKQIEFIRQTAMRAPFDFNSILGASRLLVAYGKDLEKYLPILLDWAAALGVTSGELEGYAAAMGKIMAGSPYVMRILTTRAIGIDAWNAALEQTNAALPKAERYTQALEIALQRFQGQAEVLAGTMAGLKTNIGDVWVEIAREVGLASFARVRMALFDLYQQMRDVADNQRELLWQIGDRWGMIVARIIEVVKESRKVGTYWSRMAKLVRNVAVFLIGRALVGNIVRFVMQVWRGIILFRQMGTAGQLIVTALNLASLAAGVIAAEIMRAKTAAIDFRIALGDFTAGLQILASFAERDEKIFTREEEATLRAMSVGIKEITTKLSNMGRVYADIGKMKSEGGAAALLAPLTGGMAGLWAARRYWIAFQSSFKVDAVRPMMDEVDRFVDRAAPLMDDIFGDDTWGERVNAHARAIREMAAHYEATGIVPDEDEWNNASHAFTAELLSVIPKLEPYFELSEKTRAAAEANAESYQTQKDALEAMAFIMMEYEGHMMNIPGYAENTAEYTLDQLNMLKDQMHDIQGFLPLYQSIQKVLDDTAAIEDDRLKTLGEVFDKQMESWDYSVRIAEAQAKLTGNTEGYAAALENVIGQMEKWLDIEDPDRTQEQIDVMIEALLGYRVALEKTKDTQDELTLAQAAGFNIAMQMMQPLLGVIDAVMSGTQSMSEAFKNAIKQMVAYVIRLIVQLATLAVIMSALGLTSGGDLTGIRGALSFMSGGGLERAARGYRGWVNGPTLFLAGEGGQPEYVNIAPRNRVSGGGGGGDTIIIEGPVYDGEHFMRMVDDANFKLKRRKGGGF